MGAIAVTVVSGILLGFDVISANTYGVLVLSSMVWVYVGAGLYYGFGWFKFFYHDFLGWHIPDNSPHTFDGLSEHARCKYCGKDIMQDSQGNWF